MPGKGGQWYAKTGGNFAPGVEFAAEEVKQAGMDALEVGAMIILEVAKSRVPILDLADQSEGRESGKLRESATLTRYDERLRVALSFMSPYAAYIHEHLEFKHPTGGQAKYLESAIAENREALLEEIGAAIRARLGGT